MIILKCTILKYYFLNIWLLVLLTTFNSVVFGQSSTNDYLNREVTNNLNQTILYLENLLHSLESSKIHPEQQIKKIDTYINEGQRIQTLFSDHFSALYPDKATLKDDLTQQFRHILLSLALYRSDIQTNNFKATESSQKEYDYLINRIPSVITILKMLIPVNENLVWVIHKMDELNGYLQTAYGSDAPIHFSLEGIYAKNVISIPWSDVKNMSVIRSENKVSFSSIDGSVLQFDFSEYEYSHIADMHVHFLSFYKKIAETIANNSVNKEVTIQADLERATQILKELLPNEQFYVTETGVRDKDFGMVIDFSINKQLDKPVLVIDSDSSEFEMCCFFGSEEGHAGTLNDQYYSALFIFNPKQLDSVNQLKDLFEKIIKY